MTIFAPSNEAFQFDALEKRYLESEFGSEGVGRIVGGGVVVGVGKNGAVGWSDNWGRKGMQGKHYLEPGLADQELMIDYRRICDWTGACS